METRSSRNACAARQSRRRSPHSLGKLIEWKQTSCAAAPSLPAGPHSLGKLIEWKHVSGVFSGTNTFDVPTRWGN